MDFELSEEQALIASALDRLAAPYEQDVPTPSIWLDGVPVARVVDLDLMTDTPRFCSFPPSGSSAEGLSTDSPAPADGDASVEPDAGL